MKKFVSIAALSAAIALAPTVASAEGWKRHHHNNQDYSYQHDNYRHEGGALVVIGAGAGAGALIAGPVGAAIGGVAGLFLVVAGDAANN
jgi:hypothetical protein